MLMGWASKAPIEAYFTLGLVRILGFSIQAKLGSKILTCLMHGSGLEYVTESQKPHLTYTGNDCSLATNLFEQVIESLTFGVTRLTKWGIETDMF